MIGIDSSVIIDFLKGKTFLQKYFDEGSLCELSYFEVIRGAKNYDNIDQLFDMVPCYPLTKYCMRKAVSICKDCEKIGKPIPEADALIAATLLCNGITTIVSNDKHFKLIKGLTVITY